MIEVPMHMNSEKKHSIRYDSDEKTADIITVYVMKRAFTIGAAPPVYPKNITVRVDV